MLYNFPGDLYYYVAFLPHIIQGEKQLVREEHA